MTAATAAGALPVGGFDEECCRQSRIIAAAPPSDDDAAWERITEDAMADMHDWTP
ncbi:MAG: hypothetical protein J6T92_08895 [Ottowia sp.]|nr:hypothetical protein [Ottowia sp.]